MEGVVGIEKYGDQIGFWNKAFRRPKRLLSIARSNQATARMLGLTAPDKPLATADEVLELLQPVHVVCRGA